MSSWPILCTVAIVSFALGAFWQHKRSLDMRLGTLHSIRRRFELDRSMLDHSFSGGSRERQPIQKGSAGEAIGRAASRNRPANPVRGAAHLPEDAA